MTKEEIKQKIAWIEREIAYSFESDKPKMMREIARLRKQLKTADK